MDRGAWGREGDHYSTCEINSISSVTKPSVLQRPVIQRKQLTMSNSPKWLSLDLNVFSTQRWWWFSQLSHVRPMDCSLPGTSVHGIFQARILEWVAISFSRASSRLRGRTPVSCTAGRFFTIWAPREALVVSKYLYPRVLWMWELVSESHWVVSDSLWPHGYSPWNSLGQNTGVGSLSLLQGIFQPRDQT